MAFFEVTADCLREVPATTFSAAGIRERDDLQRLLRQQIEVVVEDTLVIAEEFRDWEDSNRRIDLLGLDKDANLIVFELKRTEDGGHMELQAIRYAAMVSRMTFEKVEEIFGAFCRRLGKDVDARSTLLQFLGWEEPKENLFAQNVRIVLVSAEFSKELTTAVMWLNEQGLDVQCVRLKPYADAGRTLLDVQRIIPLPEADDYTVRIKQKQAREKAVREEERPAFEFRRRFWEGLLQFLASDGHPWAKGKNTTKEAWISSAVGKSGISANVSMAMNSRIRVEVYCWNDPDKEQYEALLKHKTEIEQRFPGETVSWEPLEDAKGSRVAVYRPYDKDQVAEDTPYRRELYAWISKNLTVIRAIAAQYLVRKPDAVEAVALE